ncbi:mucin-4 isoform X2 [Podarcis raffonei]|uniref:mucin-4 isoform X2 n=1 Tax=Podarcis raffonei TaxID=65483 RepID=UPI002329060B|nr:mucin-4 isoform X2 [Podarcis raffonei]
MGRQKGMLWALAGFWAWLLCAPGKTVAVPVPTEWEEGDLGDFTTPSDGLSWGTDSDYFEPTILTTTEAPVFMEEIQATELYTPSPLLGKPEENLSSISSANSSSPVEEERSGSPSASTLAGNVASSNDGPKNPGITPPGGNAKETTEVHAEEKAVFPAKMNSSLEEGTTKTAAVVSKEAATPVTLLSKEEEAAELPAERTEETATAPILLSASASEQPGGTELLMELVPSTTSTSLLSATSGEGIRASPSEEGANSVASGEMSFPPPAAGDEEAMDVDTRGSDVGFQLNPTVASWEETPNVIPEADEETPELSPDAGSEAAAPSSSPGADPSSHTEELPVEEEEAAPADGSSPPPPPEGDAVTPPPELPPSGSLPSGDTTAESSEPGELVAVSTQLPPADEAALDVESAPGEGRGDADSSLSAEEPESDTEATAVPSSAGPEVGPENTADVPSGESEDLLSAESSSSLPVDESTLDSPPGILSPSDAPSEPSLRMEVSSPAGLPLGSGSASQLPEDGETQASSTTNEEAKEGSGSPDSNKEASFASVSPEQGPASSGTDVPAGEEVSADLASGAASPLNPGVETDSSEVAENEQPTVSTQSEPSLDMTTINSAGVAEKVPGTLPDTKTSPTSLLEDETASEAQGSSEETPSPMSLSVTPSQQEEGEISPSETPGKVVGSSPEGSEAATGPDVASGSATTDAVAQTSSEGQSETDSPLSSLELIPPVGRSEILDTEESKSPAEDMVVTDPLGGQATFPSTSPDESPSGPSATDAMEAPSNGPPGSPPFSHLPPDNDTGAGSEVTTGPEELGHSAAGNREEPSLSPVSTAEPELAPAETEAAEDGNVSEDLGKVSALPSREETVGATSEAAVDEGSPSDSSSFLDEVNTQPPEPQLGPGSAEENSPPSSAEVADAESGDLTPLPESGGESKEAQESSEKKPSSSSSSGSFSVEDEEGEASSSPASDNLGPSPQGTDVLEGSRDGEGSTGLVENEVAGTTNSGGQAGTDLPLSGAEIGPTEKSELPAGPPGAVADGETPSQPPVEDGETLVGNTASGEESPLVTPSEKSPPSVVFEPSGAEPSGSTSSPVSYQLSPDVALNPGSATSEEAQGLEDTFSKKGLDLVPIDMGSPPASPSNDGIVATGSDLEGSEESQLSPEDAATATDEGAEPSEGSSSVGGKETYLAPSASKPPVSSSSAEEVQMDGSPSVDSEEPTLSPDDAVRAGPVTYEEGEESEDISAESGKEPSLSPLATELQSATASTEGVETAISESEPSAGSQPSQDAAGPGASEGIEQGENSSAASEQETPLGSSVGEPPKTSAGEEVSEGLVEGRPSLSTEWVDPASFEKAAGEGSQPVNAGVSNGKEPSSAPLAAEPQSDSLSTEGVEMPSLGPATDTGSQPSVDSGATAGAVASEEGEESSLAPLSPDSQSSGTPTSEDVSGGLGESSTLPEGVETGAVASEEVGESIISEKKSSLAPLSPDSQSSGTPTSEDISGGLGESPLLPEDVETPILDSATNTGSQSSPDGAAEGVVSEEGGVSEDVSPVSGKEPSLHALPTASQSSGTSASNEVSEGLGDGDSSLATEGVETAGSESAASKASQPSLDDAGTIVSNGKEASSTPLAAESPSDSLSTEEVETPSLGTATNAGSQPSADNADTAGDLASEEGEELEDISTVNGKKPSLDALSTASQSSGTSASNEVSEGLGDGDSSLTIEGLETPSMGTATDAGSHPSVDNAATAGASEEGMSGKEASFNPLSTESQSPGTLTSEDVSGGLGDGEPSLPTGGVETASLGSTATKGSTSSTETVLSPENVAEQLEEKSGSITGAESFPQPSSVIDKASGGTLPSASAYSDESLATNAGANQVSGITESSQPLPGSGDVSDNMAGLDNTGSSEKSVSGQPGSSNSDVLGGSDSSSPGAEVSTEILRGDLGTGPGSFHTEESPSALLPSSNTLPSGPANSYGKGTGNVIADGSTSQKVEEAPAGLEAGKTDSFPSDSETQESRPSPNGLLSSSPASEGRGDADSSVLAADKGPATTSTAGGTSPSLSSTHLSPANTLKLPSGAESGPEIKGGTSPLSSKSEDPGSVKPILLGKPPLKPSSPAGSGISSLPPASAQSKPAVGVGKDTSGNSKASSSAGKAPSSALGTSSSSSPVPKPMKSGSSTSSGISSLSPSPTQKKPAAGVSKVAPANSKGKPEVPLAATGDTKSSEGTGKTKKPNSRPQNSKDGKTSTADGNSAKSGRVSAVPVPVSSPAASLFPYGASANDKEYVQRKVDFNSPLFKPEIGIPLGKTLRSSLYFTDNGQIIFPASDKDISSYPNPAPKGFNGREKVPMIAVFWDNADFSRGKGTIFYQEYVTQTSAKHPVVRDVEAKIQQYLKCSYSATWTLKITWVKAQPYPAQGQNGRTNTYQAILTTDGYRTYTLFLYQNGGMQWDYRRIAPANVLIGWTSGDGYFKNDDLITKTPAEKYRPDQTEGYNTGVRGLWVYKLDSRIRVNYRRRCLDWFSHEGQPSAWNKDLPPCPCSLQQGLLDDRFSRSKKGLPDSRLTMLYSSAPNKYGAGVRCLYNSKNQLVEGHQERVWKSSRSSPNSDEELKLYDWCCNQTGNLQFCDKYSQKRPKIGCDGYRPSIRATSSEEKVDRKSEEERD